MSVAFRREGDEEHLEPKFEIPIPPGPNVVTPRGLALIGTEVTKCEAAVAALTRGDEAALAAAKRQLRYWQTREITAELAPAPTGDVVAIGTRVAFTLNGKDRTLGIVGDDEADPAAGLVSFASPLARAMIGAEPGELLPFGGKDDALEVIAITQISDL
jgi:transcription elongation GreA/GreB family factor